ncbi:hypothetical protein CHS0354_029266 [Potamilus streckersoni]|uniref:NAD-capped RNA hydrolase NUDT12 n=2 Tax=Potamilus streckersoni TaxID=2493646 RepID=A0AAE0SZI4_9BIVA|nr:hypothetical protein CHS0354_029266 [Potamilus streckersoni]
MFLAARRLQLFRLVLNLNSKGRLITCCRRMNSEPEPKSPAFSTGIQKNFEDQLFESAASGNVADLKVYLKGAVNVDVKNDHGWTALMFAARTGQVDVIKALLEAGCDVTTMNSTGQTAMDIALFWNQKECARILQHNAKINPDGSLWNYFSLNPLNRCADKRKDKTWISETMQKSTTKYILFSELKPFVTKCKEKNKSWKYTLCQVDVNDVKSYSENICIFLGVMTKNKNSPDISNDQALFALDVTGVDEKIFTDKYEDSLFLTPYPGALQLEPSVAGIFAEARSMLAWHDRYSFCPTCGSSTTVDEGGFKRVCDNKECRSHNGVHNTCHPRADPSVIMLVVSPDGKQCILGRKKTFPAKMLSCLAGFMEPGETIEDTCHRETEEETGVIVEKIEYHSSQPWPFPASLMLGCIAYATTTKIKDLVDEDELEYVKWFTRPEVVQMMTHQHPQGFFIPPKQAIAHQIIKTWIHRSANL